MLRCLRTVLGLALFLSVLPATALAQWGWGWGGWGGGWAETPGGALAHGLGALNIGAGIYNRETAVANSINTDTAIRWNQYLYECQQNALQKYIAKRDADAAHNKDVYNKIIKNLQENPTAYDIRNGDALNAALDQLANPKIQSSTLYSIAKAPLEAKVIRDIPFRNASEAVTIVLSQMKGVTKWPAQLDTGEFAEDKKAFEELIDQARKEDEEGDISPGTLSRARALISRLRAKIEQNPLPDVKDQQDSVKFIKTFAGLVKMLETPDTKQALDQLRPMERSNQKTTIGNLIAFMHVFNLRFGAAQTPQQRAIYDQLYPVLDQVRDRVVNEAKVDENVQANAGNVHDFFNKMDLDELEGKAKKETPKPPAPQQ
jgi:predicted transcriptional regulator